MPDPLSVSPRGLQNGAAVLDQLAAKLASGTAPAVTGEEECSAAAGGVSAAVAAFAKALGDRVGGRGQQLGVAAGLYTTTDDDAAGGIAGSL
jgi:hypothetical protein